MCAHIYKANEIPGEEIKRVSECRRAGGLGRAALACWADLGSPPLLYADVQVVPGRQLDTAVHGNRVEECEHVNGPVAMSLVLVIELEHLVWVVAFPVGGHFGYAAVQLRDSRYRVSYQAVGTELRVRRVEVGSRQAGFGRFLHLVTTRLFCRKRHRRKRRDWAARCAGRFRAGSRGTGSPSASSLLTHGMCSNPCRAPGSPWPAGARGLGSKRPSVSAATPSGCPRTAGSCRRSTCGLRPRG